MQGYNDVVPRMSFRKLSSCVFYGLVVLVLIYRGLSVLRSDMFSLNVFKNSLMTMMHQPDRGYDIMKVSSPIRPLQPPSQDASITGTVREEL